MKCKTGYNRCRNQCRFTKRRSSLQRKLCMKVRSSGLIFRLISSKFVKNLSTLLNSITSKLIKCAMLTPQDKELQAQLELSHRLKIRSISTIYSCKITKLSLKIAILLLLSTKGSKGQFSINKCKTGLTNSNITKIMLDTTNMTTRTWIMIMLKASPQISQA